MNTTQDSPNDCLTTNLLFPFKEIEKELQIYLSNWIKNAEQLKPVYDLYFGALSNPSMYLETKFLFIIQAVETYHRRKYGGYYIKDEEEWQSLHDKLISAICHIISLNCAEQNTSFQDSLKNKMNWSNEFSLNKRLKELFEKYNPIINVIIPKSDIFINKIVKTRNYLTHYDKKTEMDPNIMKVDSKEFRLSIERIRILLQLIFLTEMGVKESDIMKFMEHNKLFILLKSELIKENLT